MQKGSRNVPLSQASKTTKFYWKNRTSRDHHSDTNNSGSSKGKFAHTNEYKTAHLNAQKKLNTVGTNKDVEKRNGKWVKLSIKHNRGNGRYA